MTANLLHQALNELGLSPFDILIYDNYLKDPDLKISDLSTTLGVDRKKIYLSLERLIELGLAIKNGWGKVSLRSPRKISALLEQKQNQTKILLNDLDKLLPSLIDSQIGKNSQIKIFKGKSGFRDLAYELLDTTAQEELFLGSAEKYIDLLGFEYTLNWVQDRVNQKIISKNIIYANYYTANLQSQDINQLRQVKYLLNQYQSNAAYNVIGDKLAVWNPITAQAMLIQDPILCEFFKQMFNLIWELV
jgi:predicted transcriptional regulator